MKKVPLNHVLLMFYHISFKLKQLEEQEGKRSVCKYISIRWRKKMENEFEKGLIKNVNTLLKLAKDSGISRKDISDGYHTFDELYYHRMVLFSLVCNANPDKAWKSKQHHDGSMFDDTSFICGVETPEGQYTYHYHLDHWDNFKVKELEFAPEYDGHKPSDIGRLYSL